MKQAIIISTILIFIINLTSFAADSLYSVNLEGSAGYSMGVSPFYSQFAGDVSKNGVNFSLRTLWSPENILSVGFETGWNNVASLHTNAVRADLNAVPLMLIMSHDLKLFRIITGVGYFYVLSRIKDTNYSVSSGYELGFLAAVSKIYKLNNSIGLGGELKYYNLTESSKSMFSLSIILSLRLIEY